MSQTQIPIGSFRDDLDLKKILPGKIYRSIFSDDASSHDASKISVDNSAAFLNNGAFGRPYDKVQDIANQLRQFSDKNPDVFYDQVCLPLVRLSSRTASDFFGSENVLLVPNCTMAMKSILETLVKKEKGLTAAYLAPIYGATQKLLQCFEKEGSISKIKEIASGGETNALTEEDPRAIYESLKKSFAEENFKILFCDETASQSGRILPLEVVSRFCRENGVILIVDGTQSCQFLLKKNMKEILDDVDYFVMSTHKWMGNIKTCGIVRYRDGAIPPDPPGISFGWEPISSNDDLSSEDAKSRFLWIGMQDSYIAYIALGIALKIFAQHGSRQALQSSELLSNSLRNLLKVEPLLEDDPDKVRVMNIFKLNSSQLEPLASVHKIQNVLQDYGVYVSVKKFGKDCGSSNVNAVCTREDKFYLRVSCWSFNTEHDFESLALALTNNLRLSSSTNEALKNQFCFMFDLYDQLFTVLEPKAFFIRAEPLRHHLIFYYGHTAVFYINKLVVSGHLQDRINPRLESTLSVGVDEMSWDDLLENNYDWSNKTDDEQLEFLNSVRSYRQKVRQLILDLLDQHPVNLPIAFDSIHWVIMMGMEHEKIHLETSAAIIAQVPIELIKKRHQFNYPAYFDKHPSDVIKPEDVPENSMVHVPKGKVFMGKDYLEKDIYGWDNEYGHETRNLESFEASQMLVSNAEYLQFINDGGYTEAGRKWWSEEGWKFVTDLKVVGPRFWVGRTHYRTMLKVIPMPWDFPAEVNNLEAEAFCNWKSEKMGKKLRLISYEESFHMRQIAQNETVNNNMNQYASPTPVNLFGGEICGKKVYDISGNVWRHSVSVLTIMDGFKLDPFYDDFTLPTIDGRHNHILGGSWISLGNCANLNARYGFRRHFYQFAGIRYVCSRNDYHSKVSKIFEGNLMGQPATENYKDMSEEIQVREKPVKNWPCLFGQISAKVINEESSRNNNKVKVMVAHGSVGRITLEILRHCNNLNIDHTDRTANKLQVLEALLNDSKVQWYQPIEGLIEEISEYRLGPNETNGKLLEPKGNNVNYWQADYNNIRPFLDSYDVIVVDFRYKDAADHLDNITQRLKSGGLLILASIDDVTNDFGGLKHVARVLEKKFEQVKPTSLAETRFPHAYQQTRNKFQFAVSNVTVWKKLDGERSVIISPNTMADETMTPAMYYESENILLSYHKFHFGDGLLSVANFPAKIAEVCINACRKFNVNRSEALDAGCGPGRTAMDLSSFFDRVEAYDYSQGFIDLMAKEMKKRCIQNLTAFQGDSHFQSEICKSRDFDLIVGCNLIDRLNNPAKWITQCKEMLRPGGLLVISSPYTWLYEYTPLENWIGGYKKNGENFFTVDGLKELLGPELALLETHRIPFVIPDADGTYQYTYSNCTVFGDKRLKSTSRPRQLSESG